jgi:two-component system LytT family sensor kinase
LYWVRLFVPFTLLGFIFTGQVWVDYAYAAHPIAWPRATAVALSEWYAWALATPLMLALSRRFPLSRDTWRSFFAVHLPASLFCTVAAVMVGAFAARYLTGVQRPPFTFLKVHLAFFTYWTIVGVGYTLEQHRRAKEREVLALKLESQLAQARLHTLRMKLHPHFLFNALNSIAALMREDIEAADVMIARLSDLLRIALDTAEVLEVPLRKELEFLASYLEIEQARAGPRLSIRIAPDPDTLDILVPTLLLQPLVENAIRHGVHGRPGPVRVDLSARLADGRLVVEIRDDGPGPPASVAKGQGIENTEARLSTRFGPTATFELRRVPEGGAVARLVLPAEYGRDDNTHWTSA